MEITAGEYAPVKGAGPEYETLGLFGGSCLIDNLEAIAKGNELCNRYGMDTIDVGNAVAMAMEAYEKGLITEETAGCRLEWGSAEALLEMIRQIGENRGLGAILGKGVVAAAAEIGGDCPRYAIHSKGMSFPAHDPRAYASIALGYATSPRGACHLQAFSHAFERGLTMPDVGIHAPLERFTTEGKANLVFQMQNVMALFDAVCLCKFMVFGGFNVSLLTDLMRHAAGVAYDNEEILAAGEADLQPETVVQPGMRFDRERRYPFGSHTRRTAWDRRRGGESAGFGIDAERVLSNQGLGRGRKADSRNRCPVVSARVAGCAGTIREGAMMSLALRDWLEVLRRDGTLRTVSREVDPVFELPAVAKKLDGKATVLFQNG